MKLYKDIAAFLVMGLFICLAATGSPAQAEPTERFRIEPAMMVHLKSLESTVKSAQAQTLPEHRRVAEALDRDIKKLIASCTMQGEAHDALHSWLAPFIKSIRQYEKETDLPKLARAINDMQSAFQAFHTRFE